jgi:hypothetical protein
MDVDDDTTKESASGHAHPTCTTYPESTRLHGNVGRHQGSLRVRPRATGVAVHDLRHYTLLNLQRPAHALRPSPTGLSHVALLDHSMCRQRIVPADPHQVRTRLAKVVYAQGWVVGKSHDAAAFPAPCRTLAHATRGV